jgi:hypothetical protein
MYGVTTSTQDGDPSVLARLKFHESAAKWCVRWLTSMHICFGIFGFVVILLPALVKPWRLIIESTFLTSKIFYSYSSLSGLSMINLYFLIILFFVRSLFHKNLPGNQTFPITYDAIVRMELYPKTKRAEAEYWLDFLFSVASVTLWFFLPFGILAYFILGRGS